MMQWSSHGPFREHGNGRYNRASVWWEVPFPRAARPPPVMPKRLREGSGQFSEPPSCFFFPQVSLQKRAERRCQRAPLRWDRLRSPGRRHLARTPAGTAGPESPEARTGAEAAVRHVQPGAGPGGLQAALQLLDLPPDPLPLRLQLRGVGGRRGAPGHGDGGGGGGGSSDSASGSAARPGQARPGPAPRPPANRRQRRGQLSPAHVAAGSQWGARRSSREPRWVLLPARCGRGARAEGRSRSRSRSRTEAQFSSGSFTVRPRALRRCCLWT